MNDLTIEYVNVLNGSMSIGHRPKLKKIRDYKDQGVTHIWTLLCEKEGALDIKKATINSGLDWLWLSLENGKPPEPEMLPEITQCFEQCRDVLNNGARIYLHCSAGIHRTGMMSYAFLRFLGFSGEAALEMLQKMRAITSEGVGEDRLEWGDVNFG